MGAPYSAVRESSFVKTLADGTRISPKPETAKYYRDSQGRDRTERPLCDSSVDEPDALLIEIRDPVAGYGYFLDQQQRIAYRFKLTILHPRPASGPGPVQAAPVAPELQPKSEPLGSQSFDGIAAEGTRTIRVIPAGAEDNDRAITIVTETWRSADMQASLLTRTMDPRDGERTTRLTNVDRGEPDIALFQPPAEYKVVDATSRVTIRYVRPD